MGDKKTATDLQYFEDVVWEELGEAWSRIISKFGWENKDAHFLPTRSGDHFQIFKTEETMGINNLPTELNFRIFLEEVEEDEEV